MARPDLFTVTLNSLRKGRTAEELSDKLAELVDAARRTGKKGSITLTVEVKPEKGMDGTYELSDKIRANIPEADRGRTILFGTPDNNLVANDPNQQDLELRDVNQGSTPNQPLREAN